MTSEGERECVKRAVSAVKGKGEVVGGRGGEKASREGLKTGRVFGEEGGGGCGVRVGWTERVRGSRVRRGVQR